MAFITHVGVAVPRYAITQDAAATLVARSLGLSKGREAAAYALFEHAKVAKRYSVVPLEEVGRRRSLSDSMELYREQALELAAAAARDCLERASLDAKRVDLVITSSCTGMLLPSLGALLGEPLGLRRDVRRLPLTELGCAGGASALARAQDFVKAYPRARVLVLSVELPSVTFQPGDCSPGNLVASAIFGDGAAAALVQGEASTGVEIVASQTSLFPSSLGDMGFDLRDGGLHVVLSKDVPRIIAEHAPEPIETLLRRSEIGRKELEFFVLHPGGAKVLEILEDLLELERSDTRISWDVLREHGNQSSASVLFVLHETLASGVPSGYGLLAAFGPGIAMELLLLRGRR